MNTQKKFVTAIAVAVSCTLVFSQVQPTASRGELLYDTHCVTCHTTQVHWRDDKQAYDWDSLKFQVRRWQGNAGLAWDEADIAEVSRFLNETIYRYPQPGNRLGQASGMHVQPILRK